MGESLKRCVIVGAAPFADAVYLRHFVKADDHIIAADGGTRLVAAMGLSPHMVIGDFDSSMCPTKTIACTVLPTRKDDTDVLAAVRIALANGYRSFVLLGCMGGRFDHTLANLFVLRFLEEHGAHGVMIDEHHEIHLLGVGEHVLPVANGRYFSLLPYGGDVHGVTVRGASYETDNVTLDTVFPIGVSNAFDGKPVSITVKEGYLLLVLADSD